MSTTAPTTAPRPTGPVARVAALGRYRLYLLVAGAVLLVAVVRAATGAGDLTSGGAVSAALGLAVPIGMAGLGGLWAERAGVVNIGLEGMMILGTWGAGWAGSTFGPWEGVLAAVVFGALGGLVHAVATVTFRVDQIVSGVAINILGAGVARFLSTVVFGGEDGGGTTQSPRIPNLPTLSVPGISGPLDRLDGSGVFLVADVAGVLRGLLVGVSALTVIAVLLVVVSYVVLWRTPFGLRLRMCGENPTAAETLGVDVYRMKYLAVIASGGFAGLGGAFLAVVAAGIYREGQTGGRGYIGLAAMLFGNWRPGGLAMGSLLFGYTDAVQLRGADVRPLLLLVGCLLVAMAIVALLRRQAVRAAVAFVVGVVVGGTYFVVDAVPPQFTSATPYVATLLVLALASQRLRPPAAVGLRFAKGEGR
ncbi:ABC transporter permease [Rhodococcus aerolatus]